MTEQQQREQRMAAYLADLLPDLGQALNRQVAGGRNVTELVTLVSDGTIPQLAHLGPVHDVVGRDIVLSLLPTLRGLAEEDSGVKPFENLLDNPRPGTMLMMVLFEGSFGFAAYGYERVDNRLLFGGPCRVGQA